MYKGHGWAGHRISSHFLGYEQIGDNEQTPEGVPNIREFKTKPTPRL